MLPVFSRVSNIFIPLCRNTKQIYMKFARDNHYHEQIK